MQSTSSIRRWLGLMGLSVMASIAFLDFSIVFTAMPTIQRVLSVPVIDLQWVMNSFWLALATLMILSGKLSDIFGKRLVFYVGVFIFGLAAIGAGISVDFWWLVAFRGLQGVGAAVIFTTAAALAPIGFPEELQSRAIGIYSAITGFGLAIGPFLGGVLVQYLSWRWVFFVNIPLVIVGFLLCIGNLEETVKHPDTRIDWVGVALMIVGFGSLIYGIVGVGNVGFTPKVVIFFVAAVLALIFLWLVEYYIEAPLLDLQDLKNPKILLGIVTCVAASISTSAMMFVAPLYLSNVQNVTPLQLGLFMLCPPLMQVIIATFWDKISGKFGVYVPIIFAVCAALLSTVIQYGFFGVGTHYVVIIIALFLMGGVWAVANTTGVTLTYQAVKVDRAGSVIGLIFTNWNTAGVIILAVATTIFTAGEFHYMKSALVVHNVALTKAQHQTVAAMLNDPSQALQLLKQIVGPAADKILPLFKSAFIHGYKRVMLFAFVLYVLSLVFTVVLIRRCKRINAGTGKINPFAG